MQCERNEAEPFCEIVLAVSSVDFYQGCTIPIRVLAEEGEISKENVQLYINDQDMGLMESAPHTYFWNTEGLPLGEYQIRAVYSFAGKSEVSHQVSLKLLPTDVICPAELKDVDGNVYGVVQIGNQCWMKENLRSTHYANGNPLINGNDSLGDVLVNSFSLTQEELMGWYFAYNRLEINARNFGYLYSWQTVMKGETAQSEETGSIQGIAPEGWHIPSVAEWRSLIDYYGGVEIAGEMLRESGFGALPGGCRTPNGAYIEKGYGSYFWTSTETIPRHAYHIVLFCSNTKANVLGEQDSKRFGYAVRCVMD